MPIAWSTKEALDEFHRLIVLAKKPAFDFPAFIFETDFLEFFGSGQISKGIKNRALENIK